MKLFDKLRFMFHKHEYIAVKTHHFATKDTELKITVFRTDTFMKCTKCGSTRIHLYVWSEDEIIV